MKILIVSTNFPRWKGDFRIPFVFEAARAVQNKGNLVRVITMHNPGAAIDENMDGLDVHRVIYLPEKHETLQKDAAGIPAAWEKGLASRLKLLPFFAALSVAIPRRAKGFDLIHANWSLAGLAAVITRPLHRLPIITTVQGSDVYKVHDKPIIRSVIRFALRACDRVIALSSDLAKSAELLGVNPDKLVVIPNGINVDSFPMGNTNDRLNQVIYVGTLIPRKGVLTLLSAMTRIHTQIPGAKLLVIGEGDQRSELEAKVVELGLEDVVSMPGPKTQNEVSLLMRQSKVFVLPSIEEGQGVVLVEALASGTPVVGSAVGGIKDVITEDVGRLISSGNAQELAEAIREYLTNDTLWVATSEKCRRRAEATYDWNKIADAIVAEYTGVIKGKH